MTICMFKMRFETHLQGWVEIGGVSLGWHALSYYPEVAKATPWGLRQTRGTSIFYMRMMYIPPKKCCVCFKCVLRNICKVCMKLEGFHWDCMRFHIPRRLASQPHRVSLHRWTLRLDMRLMDIPPK